MTKATRDAGTPGRSHTSKASPRERVRDAIHHRQPDRTPFSWQFCATAEMQACLEETLLRQGLSWTKLRNASEEIIGIRASHTNPKFAAVSLGEWGIEWVDTAYDGGSYQEILTSPLAGIDSVAALDDYPWPSPDDYDYKSLTARLALANPGGEKAVKIWAGNPWETYSWMTGIEEALFNLAAAPELVTTALSHIGAVYEAVLRRTLEIIGHEAEIVFFYDDLGGQQGPLMSPATYREVIQPTHRRLFQAAREGAPGAKVMMHSDGDVFALLPDLIDTGLEILEAVQVDCPGMVPERLKAEFGHALSFHGALSVQQLLPRSRPDEVEAECRRLCRVLGTGGGYIAAPSHAIQLGTPVENVLAMLRGVLKPEEYEALLTQARR